MKEIPCNFTMPAEYEHEFHLELPTVRLCIKTRPPSVIMLKQQPAVAGPETAEDMSLGLDWIEETLARIQADSE